MGGGATTLRAMSDDALQADLDRLRGNRRPATAGTDSEPDERAPATRVPQA